MRSCELLAQHEKVFADMQDIRLESISTAARRMGRRENPKLILYGEVHLCEASSYIKVFRFYGCLVVRFISTSPRLDTETLYTYTTIIHNVCNDNLNEKSRLAHCKYLVRIMRDINEALTSYGDSTKPVLKEIVLK